MVKVFPLREKIFPQFKQYLQSIAGEEEGVQAQPAIKCIDYMKMLVNMQGYSLSMAILTIYSIFAIDIEKSFFGQQAAYIFGYVHIVCIMIFLMDMVLSWLCKEDYKWSFYFWIDVISTLSMAMEITWVDNFLTDNSNLPGILTIAKVVKASRLSRIGGRAAKVILMFLAYLKTKREQQQKIKAQIKNTQSVAGEQSNHNKISTFHEIRIKQDQLPQDGEQMPNKNINQNSNKIQIKQKILTPISQQNNTEKSESIEAQQRDKIVFNIKVREHKDSVHVPLFKKRSRENRHSDTMAIKRRNQRGKCFDLNNLVQRMEQTFKVEDLVRPNVDSAQAEELELKWKELCDREEEALKRQREKIHSNKQNFKLGQILKQRIQKNIIIMIMSLIIILPLISADTWFNKDPPVQKLMENYFTLVQGINDSAVAREILKNMVNTAQEGTYPMLDLWAQTVAGNVSYPGNLMENLNNFQPLSDFMRVEVIQSIGNNYSLILNGRQISQTTALINIARSCFITILLIFSTIIFMYSIQTNALIPLQKMSVSINKISINPFDALKDIKDEAEVQIQKQIEMETDILEEAVKKMTKILALGAGQIGSNLISTRNDAITSVTGCNQLPGVKVNGIFLCIKLQYFQAICQSKEVMTTLNQISTYMHDIVMQNGGSIIENHPPYSLFFWPTPEDLMIEQETTKYFMAGNPLRNLGKTVQTQKIINLVMRSYMQMNIALSELMEKFKKDQSGDDDYESFFLQAGVHIGEGYQGSVGDSLKIQIKMIGNDIRFAQSLCEMASTYKLSNLVSQDLCMIVQEMAEGHLRKVDYVKQPSKQDAFWLCTYDFALSKINQPDKQPASKRKSKKTKKERTFRQKKQRSLVLKNREQTLRKIKIDPMDVVMPFSWVQKKCLKPYSQKFYQTWNNAIDNYFSGDWDEAKCYFDSINERFDLDFKDPISLMLLDRIERNGGQPREGWDKYVELEIE